MSYVYKQFTNQDIAKIPFIAHKQYNFDSASAASHRLTYITSSYTSESVSLYSSSSAYYGGDIRNTIKYNQIDHLFYRNYRKELEKKNDFVHFLKQHRDLYGRTNILSFPAGLYGHEIKKDSFYLSSSKHNLLDDSYGNLIISGTDLNNWPDNREKNIFRLDPVKGFKNYDLSVHTDYVLVDGMGRVNAGGFVNPSPSQISNFGPPLHQLTYKDFWRQGSNNPDASSVYTTQNRQMKRTLTSEGISSSFYEPFPIGPLTRYHPLDKDDSIFCNPIHYNNVTFQESSLGSTNHKFASIGFNSATSSFIKAPHSNKYNFNTNENFAISFWIKPDLTGDLATEKRYIISKDGTETIVDTSASFSTQVASNTSQYPYLIYMQSQSLYFSRSDGKTVDIVGGEITSSAGTAEKTSHILCQYSASLMQIYFDGALLTSNTSNLEKNTRNSLDLFIGAKGDQTGSIEYNNIDKTFNGELSNINIWSYGFNSTQISNISESINASPYIGNIFYNTGFLTITHPRYNDILSNDSNGIKQIQFQGSHLIYENEYQCTIQEHEFNYSTNSSLRKNNTSNPYELEGFSSSSFFSPYVTTIGLYNEGYELLAIAKLSQPIRMSDQTDTTFVVRWDT